MSKEDGERVGGYLAQLRTARAGMSQLVREWEQVERSYRGDQPDMPGMPNTRVNIMNMQIEGQTSEIVDSEIAVTAQGQSPGDEKYAEWAQIVLEWTLRQNTPRQLLVQFARRLLKLGSAWLKAEFDPDAADGFGLVRFNCVDPQNVYVDPLVTEPRRLHRARYIMESMEISKEAAAELYGDKAAALTPTRGIGANGETYGLIQRWSRQRGQLRLEEFTEDGFLLYDSHREGTRFTNQRAAAENVVNYYAHVDGGYPYFMASCYPVEGRLHGFGDGKIIYRLQEMLNDLYDKIRLAARPNLILYNANAEMELEEFDTASFQPISYNADVPGEPVRMVPWGSINDSWWRLIYSVHQEVQRVTRYGEIMMGQAASVSTATEASILHQQGSRAVTDKKKIVQETLAQACKYAVGLMMEFYDGVKAFRLSGNTDGKAFEWIDFDMLRSVPVCTPPQDGYSRMYSERSGDSPEWQLLEENGRPYTKSVQLDLQISLGAGLPTNRTFLWQMMERFASMRLMDENGRPRPGITWEEFRRFAQNFLGIPMPSAEPPLAADFAPPPPPDMALQDAYAPVTAGGQPMRQPPV